MVSRSEKLVARSFSVHTEEEGRYSTHHFVLEYMLPCVFRKANASSSELLKLSSCLLLYCCRPC